MHKKRAGVRSIKSSPLVLPWNISVFLSWYPILELAHSLLPSLKKMLHSLEQTIQRYVYKIQFLNCHTVPISKSHTCYNVHLDVCIKCYIWYMCVFSSRCVQYTCVCARRLVEILCMCRLSRLDHVRTSVCAHSRRDSCVILQWELVEILCVSSRIPFLVEILYVILSRLITLVEIILSNIVEIVPTSWVFVHSRDELEYL